MRSSCVRACAVLAMLVVSREAKAQDGIVVRGIVGSLGGRSPVRQTAVLGFGAGLVSRDHLEFFVEFTPGVGLHYPPRLSNGRTVNTGQPITVVILAVEESQFDRLLAAGARVSTSRSANAWVFAEAAGGSARQSQVLTDGVTSSVLSGQHPVLFAGGGAAGRVKRLEVAAGYRVGVMGSGVFTELIREAHLSAGLRF